MLILAAVAAFWVKNVALDFTSLATGKTPPSHAYRMAKLREKAAREKRRLAADPDMRGGLKMVLRHCYLDACEELDAWRAGRHASRPERRAAARERRQAKDKFTSRWGWRREDPMPDDADEVIDAEIVDEDDGSSTPPPASGGRGGARSGRSSRRTTTTTTVTEEETTTARPAGAEVAVVTPDEETVKAPLPHRRMVLMTMLATAGYAPDTDAIARMTSEEVDGAIAALVAHERATREATHH